MSRHVQVDVLVIGAGGAGIAAAITAARGGADVAVIDASTTVGGTARTAGGGTCMAGTQRQRELGIEDDPDLALHDWVAMGGPTADVDWAARYLRASSGELYAWLALLGVRWGDVRLNEGNTVPRWHAPIGGGRAVMEGLERAARAEDRVRWHLGVRVDALLREGGRVVGVLAERTSKAFELRASSVLVATGGFNNAARKVREQLPDVPQVLLGGGRGARGLGHDLLAAVDADFVNLDAVWMYPYGITDHLEPGTGRGLAVRGIDGDIWVNREGERFHDESLRGGATGTPALLAQPGATAWSIIDRRLADELIVADPRYRHGDVADREAIEQLLCTSPDIHQAADLRTLAAMIGVDEVNLGREVDEQNAARRRGDAYDGFGRPLAELRPLDEPPYLALRFLPLARKNLGGVRTDRQGQVLDREGRPVSGLFAAGEVAGMAGGSINGRGALEGTMFGPSIFSGRVAAEAMLA